MPIIAKNVTVGVQKTPTAASPKKPPAAKPEPVSTTSSRIKVFGEFVDKSKKPEVIQASKPEPPKPVVKKIVKTVEEEVEPSIYIQKKDGELIRHINTKSNYLKDVFDLDS